MARAPSPRFESVAEIQPLRAFLSIYAVLFLLLGVELARLVLGSSLLRNSICFVPVCLCMFLVQRAAFPASNHLQLPWRNDSNDWMKAFVWVRDNTPVSAVFALNPHHMNMAGEDNQGFRAVAERSMLADACKDSGVVTMFPALAKSWEQQVSSVLRWDHFSAADFQRLSALYGVSWLVLEKPIAGIVCPYRNGSLLVCKIQALPAPPAHIYGPNPIPPPKFRSFAPAAARN